MSEPHVAQHRALRLHGARDARVESVAVPALVPGSVRVRVEWAGICGTDLRLFAHGPADAASHPLLSDSGPRVLGHELAGTVVELAPDVTGIPVGSAAAIRPNVWDGTCPSCRRGDTNICRHWGFVGVNGGGGGFSEYVVVPAESVHLLPAHIGTDVGALVESTAVGWHAAKRSGVRPGDVGLVVGGGPIGLAVTMSLLALGAATVIVSEPSARRADLARSLGAVVTDPRTDDLAEVLAMHAPDGADVAFDAAGISPATFRAAYGSVRRGGRMVVVARVHDPIPFDFGDVLFTEREITGSFSYTDEDFAEALAAIADGRIDPSPLISRRIALDDVVPQGLELLLGEGRDSEVKILVTPSASAPLSESDH